MIYTSYFAGLRNLPTTIVPIAISRTVPDWYTGEKYFPLAPSWEILQSYKTYHDKEQFARRYNVILNNLDAVKIAEELKNIANQKPFALICYEKPSDFCHRQLVAEWFEKNGFPCREWQEVL